MRPGYSASSVPNCSAITIGEWLGSMMPPAPMRIVEVPPARWPMTTEVAALAMPGHVVVLGHPEPAVAEPLGVAGEVDAAGQRVGRGRPLVDRDEIEDAQGNHAGAAASFSAIHG